MAKQLSLFTKQLDSLKNITSRLKKASKIDTRKKTLTAKRTKGNKAEELACEFLLKKGLLLKQKNFNTPAGEIDLIMLDPRKNRQGVSNDSLVFIEVRYRKNTNFGGAAASVTPKKQQRIIKAALAYQQQNAPQSSMRFDVVAIEGDNINNDTEINWIENAFSGF